MKPMTIAPALQGSSAPAPSDASKAVPAAERGVFSNVLHEAGQPALRCNIPADEASEGEEPAAKTNGHGEIFAMFAAHLFASPVSAKSSQAASGAGEGDGARAVGPIARGEGMPLPDGPISGTEVATDRTRKDRPGKASMREGDGALPIPQALPQPQTGLRVPDGMVMVAPPQPAMTAAVPVQADIPRQALSFSLASPLRLEPLTQTGVVAGRFVMSVQPEGLGMVTVALTRTGDNMELAITADPRVSEAIQREPSEFIAAIRETLSVAGDVSIRIVPQGEAGITLTSGQRPGMDGAPHAGQRDGGRRSGAPDARPHEPDANGADLASGDATLKRVMV